MCKKDIVEFVAIGQFLVAMSLILFTDVVPETALGGVLFSIPFVLAPIIAYIAIPADFCLFEKDE